MRYSIDPERLRQLLNYNPQTGQFTWSGGPHKGEPALATAHSEGYLHGTVRKEQMYAHRAAWAIVHGEWPDLDIDHINGDRSDNRIVNLRSVSRQQNLRNMRLRDANNSGVCGVSWKPNLSRWRARIRVNYRDICLGYYNCKTAAMIARKRAERKYGFHKNHGRAL